MRALLILSMICCASAKASVLSTFELAKKDFDETNKAYTIHIGISMDTYYKVYSNHTAQSLIEAKNGKYLRFKAKSYTLIDNIETIELNSKIISIDKGMRQITVGDNKGEKGLILGGNLDSLLNLCEDVVLGDESANFRTWKLILGNSPSSEFSRVDVTIDIKNHRYSKIVLFYAISINLKSDFYAEEEKPRIEIEYKNFKLLQDEPLLFHESNYVVEADGKLIPSPSLKNYKLKDLRNSTMIKRKR